MSDSTTTPTLETIVSLCKRRGFIYPGSDVYGGLSGTWDYGPLGVALKRNIMALWWKMFVDDREDMYGVDAAILMNQKVWQASGHTETFTDPLVGCSSCKARFRVDKIISDPEEYSRFLNTFLETQDKKLEELRQDLKRLMPSALKGTQINPEVVEGMEMGKLKSFVNTISQNTVEGGVILDKYRELQKNYDYAEQARIYVGPLVREYLNTHEKCSRCGSQTWDEPRHFNMMFKTHIGPVDEKYIEGGATIVSNIDTTSGKSSGGVVETSETKKFSFNDDTSLVYLRPETAQGIFTNYKNVVDNFYPDVPFGIAQQGKAFRNEISPRDFIFRSREFEQMEIEYFVHPDNWEEAFEHWRQQVWKWTQALGLPHASVHELEVPDEDRAHYSKRTIDFEFDFPIGKEELLGLAYRTDFDLMNIQKASGKSMEYRPKDNSAAYVPHVIEPSFGVERAIMAVLTVAYTEDEVNGEKRTYLRLPTHLAPIRVAVSPLLKNKPDLVKKAREVYDMLKKEYGNVMWDDNGNIGKRYRRQDEIGTPYCVVIDFDTLEGDFRDTVTVRNRDTTEQRRVKVEALNAELDS